MTNMVRKLGIMVSAIGSFAMAGCAIGNGNLPPAPSVPAQQAPSEEYRIGTFDGLQIFVWRNPELGANVQVRPDGRITTPLITDMPAAGKTTTMLAQDIKLQLSQYINDPIVSVIVKKFGQQTEQQVRIVGGTEKPATIAYRANMSLLDAVIAVGGLSEFASGNKATLRRNGRLYRLRISDLIKRGDSTADILLQSGDVITIPESSF